MSEHAHSPTRLQTLASLVTGAPPRRPSTPTLFYGSPFQDEEDSPQNLQPKRKGSVIDKLKTGENEIELQSPHSPTSIVAQPRNLTEQTQTLRELDSSDLEDELLTTKGEGFIGFVEGLPLWVKLGTMNCCSLAGLVFLGVIILVLVIANTLSTNSTNRYKELTTSCDAFLVTVQDEMIATAYYMATNGTVNGAALTTARTKTATAWTNFVDNIDSTKSPRVMETITALNAAYATLPTARQMADSLNLTAAAGVQTLDYYNNLNTRVCAYISTFSHSDSNDIQTSVTQRGALFQLLTYRLTQSVARVVAYGPYLSNTGVTNTFTYTSLLVQADQFYGLWKPMIYIRYSTLYEKNILGNASINAARSELAANMVSNPQQLYQNTSMWMAQMRQIQTSLNNDIIASLNSSVTTSVVYIVLAFLFIGFFFISSVVVAYLLSRTISGPWQRLNKLQELTIRKFVPQS
jgi:hypothetical protein